MRIRVVIGHDPETNVRFSPFFSPLATHLRSSFFPHFSFPLAQPLISSRRLCPSARSHSWRASFHSAIVNYRARRVYLPSRRERTAITRDGEQLPFVRRPVIFPLCLSAVYLFRFSRNFSRNSFVTRPFAEFKAACLSIPGFSQRTLTRAFFRVAKIPFSHPARLR